MKNKSKTTEHSARKILGRIGEELLGLVEDAGELMADIAFTPYGKLSIHSMHVPKSTFYSAMGRFEKNGLIVKKKKAYNNVYVITPEGKRLLKLLKRPEKRMDGFSTLIIFDIPEEKSRQRTILRRYLVRNGYTMLQKSVFISPLKISEELKNLIPELELRPYISFLSVKVDYTL